MNVDLMRKIDRSAGIPLTFLMTWLLRIGSLLKFWHKKPDTIDVSNTLLLELSEMGSAIIADPAMRHLQQEGAKLHFAIFKDNAKSLFLLNTIDADNVYCFRSDSLLNLAIDSIKFIFWCRKKRITCAIDLELFSRATALLSALSFAPSRVGFTTLHDEGCYRGNIVNYPVRYNSHAHIGVNFFSLINRALGRFNNAYATQVVSEEQLMLKKAEVNPDYTLSVKDKLAGLYPDFSQHRIVLINPNASDLLPQRRWLPERFAQVMKRLLEEHDDILLVITGAPNEKEGADWLMNEVNHSRCVSSAGLFAFEELVSLYQQSVFMLTNDSGPAHFAALTDLQVLVIFGPETPRLYLPLGGNADYIYLGLPCSPCVSAFNHRKTSCEARPCISEITSDQVFERVNQYLNQVSVKAINV